MRRKIYLVVICCVGVFTSCESWLDDGETSPNLVIEGGFNQEYLFGKMNGDNFVMGPNLVSIKEKSTALFSQLYVCAAAISDEFGVPAQANSLLYRDLSNDDLNIHDGSLRSIWSTTYALYDFSSDMLQYAENTNWGEGADSQEIKNTSLWHCNLYKGLALYNLAAYFNGNQQTDESPYVYIDTQEVANSQVFDMAEKAVQNSLKYAGEYQERVSNTLLVRLAVLSGDFEAALPYVNNMLSSNDEPITASHELTNNTMFTVAGLGSRDAKLNDGFVNAMTIPAAKQLNSNQLDPSSGDRIQTRFGQYDDQILISYPEAELLRAELILHAAITGDFAECLNNVANYYDNTGNSVVNDLAMNQENLIHYRRMFLALNGQRILDQRRFLLDGEDVIPFTSRSWKYIGIDDIEN